MTQAAKPSSWNPDRLDVLAMARAAGHLQMRDALARYPRLAAECADGSAGEREVGWQAQAELRREAAHETPWLRVQADAELPVTCQRCLQPVPVPLAVDRWFRFVADEATAEAEDEDSDEDVLALEPRPSLRELIEDELLMALPLVPMHDQCPEPLAAAATAPDAQQDAPADGRPNPFSALARLKR